MENFTNRPIKRSTGSYREESENFEQKADRIWHSETETTIKNKICCYMSQRESEKAH
jgi:hypothetical protein